MCLEMQSTVDRNLNLHTNFSCGNKQGARLSKAKIEIRSVLLTYPSSVTLEEFHKSYKVLLGERFSSKGYGYSSEVEFLQSMPDVANVSIDRSGKVSLTGIADKSSEHIQKLVSKQKKCQTKKSNKCSPKHIKRNATNFRAKEQPFVPGILRAEILKLMDKYHDGVTFCAFALAYHREFNKYLPLVKGLDSIEDMVSLIPELEVRTVNNEKIIYYVNNNHINYNHRKTSLNGKNISPSHQAKGKEFKAVVPAINSTNMHSSGITDSVLQNFQLLIQKYPDGILDVHFPAVYQMLTNENFDLLELGYSSIVELVDALPCVFKRIPSPNRNKNWLIISAKATDKNFYLKEEDSTSTSSQMKTSSKIPEKIPADAASPSLPFVQPMIPENMDLNEYIPVFISAIKSPRLFWFQLQTEDIIKKFEKFQTDLGYFYDSPTNYKYLMEDADITIGATCVVLCPEDRQWYRAVIESIPNSKFVNVLFVDYGSKENVPITNIYYVRNRYHDYPAQAFEAQLAGLKPSNNAILYDIKAQRRFIELCECSYLMARLFPVDNGTFSTYLCDTSGDSDIHLNDALVNEGFAELCFKNQCNVQNSCLPDDYKEPVYNEITSSESECCFSPESSEEYLCVSANETDSSYESQTLHVEKRFLPKEQVNDTDPEVSFNERQGSKRYVKQVQLYEDYKIHVINLENKLFMTCGDVSRLLWKEKDSIVLIERLKYKEVEVPFIKLSKEQYAPLFEQCIWYEIPEYEKLEASNSSLILYPLECAFNILNIFGHPSVCLRLAIQNEIRHFDPFDPIWKEFNFAELHDLNIMEKEIEEQLCKLCVYDLKTKHAALTIKRMKLMRAENASSSAEIKKLDVFLNVINRRTKEIEAMCSQYSNCS